MQAWHAAISRYRFAFAVTAALGLGTALRLALILAADGRIDYDEAMIGLLARRIMRGEWVAFVPAQPTLGALEAYLLTPFFFFGGAGPGALRLLSLVSNAAYILTTALVGRAAWGERGGAWAGLAAALAPPYMLFTGLKTWGVTIDTMVLGNVLFLLTAHALRSPRKWAGLGAFFVAGLLFWGGWLAFYYLLPAALVGGYGLYRRSGAVHRRVGGWAALAALAFFTGSLPVWVHNVRHDFETFEALRAAPLSLETRLRVAKHLVTDLSVRLVSADGRWGVVSPMGRAALVGAYGAGAAALVYGLKQRRGSGVPLRWMVALMLGAVPVLYLGSTYGASALNPFGVDATGRYVLMVHTALPVGLAALATMRGAGRWLPALPVMLVLALNLSGAAKVDERRGFASPYYDRLPPTRAPLIAFLDAKGYRYVWTDVGLAQVLTFETDERIRAADYYDIKIAGGLLRFPAIFAAVEKADYAVYVAVIRPGQVDFRLRQAFDAAGLAYSIAYPMPTLAVIMPVGRVHPAQVASGLGYQY